MIAISILILKLQAPTVVDLVLLVLNLFPALFAIQEVARDLFGSYLGCRFGMEEAASDLPLCMFEFIAGPRVC